MADDADKNRLIIDSDWKSEAQAEKDRLEAESAKADQDKQQGQGQMPEPDFRGLVGMIATQALMYMGAIADPQSGKAIFDPHYAKHMIDLLGTLEEKTKGNLNDDESKELTEILRELRSRFVELSQMVAQQQSQQGGQPGGANPADMPADIRMGPTPPGQSPGQAPGQSPGQGPIMPG
jgi:hypothetical protein